jgi:translation initiation factor 1 (eIF-1/SUI1)
MKKIAAFNGFVRNFKPEDLHGKELQIMVSTEVDADGKTVTVIAGFDFSTGNMYILSEKVEG